MAKHQSALSNFLILKRFASAFTASAADGDSTQITLTLKKVRDKCKLSCCPHCDYRNGKLSYTVRNHFTLEMLLLKHGYCLFQEMNW